MNSKIKVSAVSYLNTKPLLYGLERHPVINSIDLILEYPSLIAKHLQDGSIDLGLVPVAAIPTIPQAEIIADYGIAADGAVASVCIFSHQPIEQVDKLYLDYQSRTSVKLAQVLLKEYWKKEVQLLQSPENYIDLIEGNTAGVIIGDRALQNLSKFEYIYDLATYWKKLTNLPFIFAAWVANKPLPSSFVHAFNEANNLGIQNIDKVVLSNPYTYYDLNIYYHNNILYHLDDNKRKGLAAFLKYL